MAERPPIASVIYNRLKERIRLDIDATIRYAVDNWTRPLRHPSSNPSPYNTREHQGLPPAPIGNPGLASIKAAATRPDAVPRLRGQACGNGEHKFAEERRRVPARCRGVQGRREAGGGGAHQLLSTLTGVLGFPVAHSRSPAMMNAGFAELGLDWRYRWRCAPPERSPRPSARSPARATGGPTSPSRTSSPRSRRLRADLGRRGDRRREHARVRRGAGRRRQHGRGRAA